MASRNTSVALAILMFCGCLFAAEAVGAGKLAALRLYLPPDGIQYGSFDGPRKLSFIWIEVPGAKSYRLQVCKNADWSGILVNAKVQEPYYAIMNAPDNLALYWRACAIDTAGVQGPWSEAQKVVLGYPERAGLMAPLAITDERVLGVVPLAPRKDTRMLCLDAAAGEAVPGCQLNTPNHPWNNTHTGAADHCAHEEFGCWLVAAQMINHYRGHNATFDQLKFRMFRYKNPTPAPEGDSPHGQAGASGGSIESEYIVQYALDDPYAQWVAGPKPNEDQIRAFIDPLAPGQPGRPIRWSEDAGGVAHATVIDGYHMNGADFEVHQLNPLNDGGATWTKYSEPYGLSCLGYMCPAVGASGIDADPSMNTDSDGDGMVDFDEVNRFGTNPNDPDTDHDGISDMTEVFSYAIARSPKVNADFDGDGLRAEKDFDSDRGGKPDGYEDRDCDGVKDADETNVYDSTDDGTIPTNLTLTNMTISTKQTYLARNSMSVAPSVTVTSTGDVIFAAGNTINLNSGLQTNNGLKMKVWVDPNLR